MSSPDVLRPPIQRVLRCIQAPSATLLRSDGVIGPDGARGSDLRFGPGPLRFGRPRPCAFTPRAAHNCDWRASTDSPGSTSMASGSLAAQFETNSAVAPSTSSTSSWRET